MTERRTGWTCRLRDPRPPEQRALEREVPADDPRDWGFQPRVQDDERLGLGPAGEGRQP